MQADEDVETALMSETLIGLVVFGAARILKAVATDPKSQSFASKLLIAYLLIMVVWLLEMFTDDWRLLSFCARGLWRLLSETSSWMGLEWFGKGA
jgi:hypothetical protein